MVSRKDQTFYVDLEEDAPLNVTGHHHDHHASSLVRQMAQPPSNWPGGWHATGADREDDRQRETNSMPSYLFVRAP